MSDGKSWFITQWSAWHYCHSKERESCVCAVDGKLSMYISCGGKFEQNMCRKIPFVYMGMYIFTWTELSGRSFSLCLQEKGKGFPFYFKSFSTQLALVVKTAYQCRRHQRCGFNPWIGKIPWKRAWQPTAVFLPGESPGTEEPGGLYSPQGRKESDQTD